MKIQAVVFDLDGTLTRPFLDFDGIRAEIGGIDGPILEAIERMSEAERTRAETILLEHERIAAEQAELNPGAAELLTALRNEGRLLGLLTRNSAISVRTICQAHSLQFDAIITREDEGPVKPDPYPFEQVCRKLGVAPNRALMVGDYRFDLHCGRDAGAKTVLLTTNPNHHDFAHEADFVIDRLDKLLAVIEQLEHEQENSSAGRS